MSKKSDVEWTPEDEIKLVSLCSIYGNEHNKWELISKEMGRTYESCRSRWRLIKNNVKSNLNEPVYVEKENPEASSRVEYGDDTIRVIQASRRIMSQEELMEAYHIDPTKWQVEKYIIRTSEGYRKDRQVSWHVIDGQVVSGDVEDSGKMLVVPLYHMELRLIRKEAEERARGAIEEMMQDAKKFAPKYPDIKYTPHKDKMLYEIAMPDIHFGRLTWHEESGDDFVYVNFHNLPSF